MKVTVRAGAGLGPGGGLVSVPARSLAYIILPPPGERQDPRPGEGGASLRSKLSGCHLGRLREAGVMVCTDVCLSVASEKSP